MPQPRYARAGTGAFAWPARACITVSGARDDAASALRTFLRRHGIAATVEPARAARRCAAALARTHAADPRLGTEGYALRVRPDGITLGANAPAGLFYGVQTLEQITHRSRGGVVSSSATIVDRPEYRWRGIHLDVARRFFPVPVVERYVDVAAHYKLNVLHWHLTDDEAWRFPSARYPALGAHGERYSNADVRALVAYAARRFVTVVPEIDMPAHAGAALRAYPALACGATLCTGAAGLAFARTVLDETAALFPSRVVHAGGDEVPPPAAAGQARFVAALARHLAARGRRLGAWDDMHVGGVPPGTVVTVWTSRARAAQLAREDVDVVVASAPLYFDAAQGDPSQEPPATPHLATLENVYDDPIMPRGLDTAASAHVLGGQANLWTEHVRTSDALFALALPREIALAENLWTPRASKSWPSFLARLPGQLAWLDAHGYRFRIPNVAFALEGGPSSFEAVPGHVQSVLVQTAARAITVRLSVPLRDAAVRYTLDGTAPTTASPRYVRAFTLRPASRRFVLRAAAFFRGRRGAVTEADVVPVPPRNIRRSRSTSWASLVSP